MRRQGRPPADRYQDSSMNTSDVEMGAPAASLSRASCSDKVLRSADIHISAIGRMHEQPSRSAATTVGLLGQHGASSGCCICPYLHLHVVVLLTASSVTSSTARECRMPALFLWIINLTTPPQQSAAQQLTPASAEPKSSSSLPCAPLGCTAR